MRTARGRDGGDRRLHLHHVPIRFPDFCSGFWDRPGSVAAGFAACTVVGHGDNARSPRTADEPPPGPCTASVSLEAALDGSVAQGPLITFQRLPGNGVTRGQGGASEQRSPVALLSSHRSVLWLPGECLRRKTRETPALRARWTSRRGLPALVGEHGRRAFSRPPSAKTPRSTPSQRHRDPGRVNPAARTALGSNPDHPRPRLGEHWGPASRPRLGLPGHLDPGFSS